MSLLRKASIVTTPTAYENGKILSVKPSIVLGQELVTNGTFQTDSDWTLGTGWSIGDNKATKVAGSASGIEQPNIFENGKKYKLNFTVSDYVAGGLIAFIGQGTQNIVNVNSGGDKEVIFTSTVSQNKLLLNANSFFIGSVSNVSVKEVLDADFDFTRNSSATRVNSQGLIEDMQILSGNLVSNGDFSQESSELVTNGDFATDTNWTKGAGVTISGGKANWTNTINNVGVTQSGIMTSSKNYKVVFTVSNYSSGSVRLRFPSITERVTSNGTYTYYINATDTNLYIQGETNGDANVNLSIDNVSVKEVGQNWTLGTGWSIGEDNAIFDDTSTGRISQTGLSIISGKSYKIDFTIADCPTTAHMTIYDAGGSDLILPNENYVNGSYTRYYTATTNETGVSFWGNTAGDTFSISNISLIEITEDTNLPRIDYTGGEGHWLFEPQSTNLIITSDSGVYGNDPASEILTTAPDGTNTAVRPVSDSNSDRYTGQISGGTYATNTKITYSWYRKRISTPVVDTYVGDLEPKALVNVTQVGSTIQVKSDINGFDRFSTTFNITDGSLASNIRLYFGEIIGTGNSSVAYWGHQLEVGSFATSLIPTSGSTVTRLADAANGAGSSDLINSTEGVLYAEIAAFTQRPNLRRDIALSDGTRADNIVRIHYLNAVDNTIRVQVRSGGSITASVNTTVTDIRDFHKVAISYKVNEVKLYIDGVLINTDTNAAMPIGLNQLSFSDGDGTQNIFFGKTKCVAVFKEALTDAELTCLTTI